MAEPRTNGHESVSNGVDRELNAYEKFGRSPLPNGHDVESYTLPHGLTLEARIGALTRAIEQQGEQLRETVQGEGIQNRYRMQLDAVHLGGKIELAAEKIAAAHQNQGYGFSGELADNRALFGRMIEDMGKNLAQSAGRAKERLRDRHYATSETRYSNGLVAGKRFQGMRWMRPDRDEMREMRAEYRQDQKAMKKAWKQERGKLTMWEKYGPGSRRHKEVFERDWQRERLGADGRSVYDKYGPGREVSQEQQRDRKHSGIER